MPDDARTNIQYLLEHGPTARGELPVEISSADKQAGVWQFGKRSGASRTDRFGRGIRISQTSLVYYLKDHHDPADAAIAWFDSNREHIHTPLRREVTTIVASNEKAWWPDDVRKRVWGYVSEHFEVA